MNNINALLPWNVVNQIAPFRLAAGSFASIRRMDNPLEMILPIAGFIGGILLWSRVAHTVIAVSGVTPTPTNPVNDLVAMEKAYRRIVFLIAIGWLGVIGAVLAYMVYRDKTGFALLFGGILAVPLFTVPNFLILVRRHKRRAEARKSKLPD